MSSHQNKIVQENTHISTSVLYTFALWIFLVHTHAFYGHVNNIIFHLLLLTYLILVKNFKFFTHILNSNRRNASNCWLRDNTEYRIHINTIYNLSPYQIHVPSPNCPLFVAIKSKARYRFNEAAILFSYVSQKYTSTNGVSFLFISVLTHNSRNLYLVVLVSFLPKKLLRPSCWWYWLWEFKIYKFEIISSGVISNQISSKSVQRFSSCNMRTDRLDRPCMRVFSLHRARNA
jgi:hypothetical protein